MGKKAVGFLVTTKHDAERVSIDVWGNQFSIPISITACICRRPLFSKQIELGYSKEDFTKIEYEQIVKIVKQFIYRGALHRLFQHLGECDDTELLEKLYSKFHDKLPIGEQEFDRFQAEIDEGIGS